MARRKASQAPRSTPDILKSLGSQLRQLRLERGITQERLAELAGLSYKYIGRVELAKADPGAAVLVRLARALRVSVGELFETITPTSASGYRVSPADVGNVNTAIAMLGDVVSRVTSGQPPRLPVRAPRTRRR